MSLPPSRCSAGYAARVITPPLGTELTGFGFYRERRAENILDDLHVRALSVSDGPTRLLLLCCDLLSFSITDSDHLRATIAAEHGLPRTHVLLACTHIHSGPAVQPLEGLGVIDPAYQHWVMAEIVRAAREAVADERPASFRERLETVEPIGYNRRHNTFTPIDPVLAMAAFTRDDHTLYLLEYACHPVTMGASPAVTADWPGAAARAIEARGDAAIVFQGFCGDINPIIALNRWNDATPEDYRIPGELLARRARQMLPFAEEITPALSAVEQRITLPLAVPTAEEIRARADHWLAQPPWGNSHRFYTWWRKHALACRDAAAADPCIHDVPIQALALGPVALIALPGEVFCDYALALRRRHPALLTVGYANGNTGYLPTAAAYANPDDYACHSAPTFYTTFPFVPEVEGLVRLACEDALDALAMPLSAHESIEQHTGQSRDLCATE